MEKKKVRKILASCFALVLLCTMTICISATGKRYDAYLPSFQKHTNVCIGEKTSPYSTYAVNTLTGPTDNVRGYFWIDLQANNSQISDGAYCEYGKRTVIPYMKMNGGGVAGNMILRGMTAEWCITSRFTQGEIDFG